MAQFDKDVIEEETPEL